jgi:hypothetical protein
MRILFRVLYLPPESLLWLVQRELYRWKFFWTLRYQVCSSQRTCEGNLSHIWNRISCNGSESWIKDDAKQCCNRFQDCTSCTLKQSCGWCYDVDSRCVSGTKTCLQHRLSSNLDPQRSDIRTVRLHRPVRYMGASTIQLCCIECSARNGDQRAVGRE